MGDRDRLERLIGIAGMLNRMIRILDPAGALIRDAGGFELGLLCGDLLAQLLEPSDSGFFTSAAAANRANASAKASGDASVIGPPASTEVASSGFHARRSCAPTPPWPRQASLRARREDLRS
jgi:hypothetical protein